MEEPRHKKGQRPLNKLFEYMADKVVDIQSVGKNFQDDWGTRGVWNYFSSSQESGSSQNTSDRTAGKAIDLWASQYTALPSDQQELLLVQYVNILQSDIVDLERLRVLSHYGIPNEVRSPVWQLLLGYLPVNKSEQARSLSEKREKYWKLVQKCYPSEEVRNKQTDPLHLQIVVDVPRTMPPGLERFMGRESIKETLTRILYVYSVAHQSSNYWQGLNEIPVPFLAIFLAFFVNCTLNQLNLLSEESIAQNLQSGNVEADVYWCLARFVNGLQLRGDYVVAKYGDITEEHILERFGLLCKMVDVELYEDLKSKGIEMVHFAFRWMVCLLIREMPISALVRLWDCYLAEGEGMLSFHLYITISFLLTFAEDIKNIPSFEHTLIFVQNLPTEHWTEAHAEYLIKRAYQTKVVDCAFRKSAAGLATVFLVAFVAAATLLAYKRCLESPSSFQ